MLDKTVTLIDGMNLCRRMLHTMPLTAQDGTPTGVIYGVVNMVRKELNAGRDVIFCWDSKCHWRRAILPTYKANRVTQPDPGFLPQLMTIESIFQTCRISQIRVADLEADDLIGLLSYRLKDEYKKVVILSADRDLIQLVRKGVQLWRPLGKGKFEKLNFKAVLRTYKLKPKEWTLACALSGGHNNDKGVKGIGPATAKKMVAAGVNPAKATPNSIVKKQFPKLLPHWEIVHKNYLVSKLDSSTKKFGKAATSIDQAVTRSIDCCRNRMFNCKADKAKAWKDFTRLCVELDLTQFMTSRSDFFNGTSCLR